eukprot:TCALIF_04786-PA protein Name:"Protein of unknown function" AED:0.00 eAED:0.00 QI:149/1/1/1/1/1/4/330/38
MRIAVSTTIANRESPFELSAKPIGFLMLQTNIATILTG